MGFSGGGSNILKSHTHDGTVVQDGGALNLDNVTQGSLTAGDVVYSDGSHLQRLAIGSAGNSLQVNSLATAPEWAAGGGSVSISQQVVSPTNAQNTTSASFVDVTGGSITLPTRAGGYAFLSAFAMVNNSSANANIKLGIHRGGSLQEVQTVRITDAFNEWPVSVTAIHPLDGSVVKLQWAVNSGITATLINIAGTNSSSFQSFEVG
jgi:hypothetical protein